MKPQSKGNKGEMSDGDVMMGLDEEQKLGDVERSHCYPAVG